MGKPQTDLSAHKADEPMIERTDNDKDERRFPSGTTSKGAILLSANSYLSPGCGTAVSALACLRSSAASAALPWRP